MTHLKPPTSSRIHSHHKLLGGGDACMTSVNETRQRLPPGIWAGSAGLSWAEWEEGPCGASQLLHDSCLCWRKLFLLVCTRELDAGYQLLSVKETLMLSTPTRLSLRDFAMSFFHHCARHWRSHGGNGWTRLSPPMLYANYTIIHTEWIITCFSKMYKNNSIEQLWSCVSLSDWR